MTLSTGCKAVVLKRPDVTVGVDPQAGYRSVFIPRLDDLATVPNVVLHAVTEDILDEGIQLRYRPRRN